MITCREMRWKRKSGGGGGGAAILDIGYWDKTLNLASIFVNTVRKATQVPMLLSKKLAPYKVLKAFALML